MTDAVQLRSTLGSAFRSGQAYCGAVGLRELRAEHVLSQHDLAVRTGISKTTIVKIEAGRIRPHPLTVRKIAKALGLPARELMTHVQPGVNQ